jgi:mRNA interferase MazF
MTKLSLPSPRRGEVWWVDFDPAVGDEIQKTRPAVVISSDLLGKLRLKLVVPLTSWQPKFAENPWMVQALATGPNGLTNDSAADTLQTQSVSLDRFKTRKGILEPHVVGEVLEALATLIELK